ncbi:MAG TPA: TIGR03086 family metal-binding protein [Mycobacteriales bacterium]|jgi:TIGR03086 family protein
MSQIIATQFRQVADGFAARIEATPADRWSAPSPCADWTARDVVEHVLGGLRMVLSSITGGTPDPVTENTDLVAAWHEIQQNVLTSLSDPETAARSFRSPIGEMTFEQAVARLAVIEVLVHTWDLARAVGGDERLDADLVRQAHEQFKPLDSRLRGTGAFGPKVEPPAGADAQTEFLCFLGRQV